MYPQEHNSVNNLNKFGSIFFPRFSSRSDSSSASTLIIVLCDPKQRMQLNCPKLWPTENMKHVLFKAVNFMVIVRQEYKMNIRFNVNLSWISVNYLSKKFFFQGHNLILIYHIENPMRNPHDIKWGKAILS